MSRADFWRSTPVEIDQEIRARADAAKERMVSDLFVAYHTAVFMRHKRPHEVYRKLVRQIKGRHGREMSDEAMLATMRAAFPKREG